MKTDLTQGTPWKRIVAFTVPILLGNIFQQLYNIADTLIVGRTISNEALAAVGCTWALSFITVVFSVGLTMGFSVKLGHAYGAGDQEEMRFSYATNLLLSALFALLLVLVSYPLAGPLIRVLSTPADIAADAEAYISIIFLGLGATLFYNAATNVCRALGDSRMPLLFLILCSLLNIGLDLLFILVFSMGVKGAAWATVVSQAISAAVSFIYITLKFPLLRLSKRHFMVGLKRLWSHFRLGFPMGLQMSVVGIGMLAVQFAVNRLGTEYVTAYTAAGKVESFLIQFPLSIGIAMSPFAAQNWGKQAYDRIRQGVRGMLVASYAVTAVCVAVLLLWGGSLAALFLDNVTPRIQQLLNSYMAIIAPNYVWLVLIYVFRNTLQGMDNVLCPFIACLAELIGRTAGALLLGEAFGWAGAIWASPCAWFLAGAVVTFGYIRMIHKKPFKQEVSIRAH